MNYKAMLSPQTESNSGIRVVVAGAWGTPPENFRNMQYWRSRAEFLSRDRVLSKHIRWNWNAVMGLAITTGISAAFWIAIGLTVSHFWK